jgi:hypothetical protein
MLAVLAAAEVERKDKHVEYSAGTKPKENENCTHEAPLREDETPVAVEPTKGEEGG